MIDVYAAAGTFTQPQALAQDLATALMTIEQVPDIPMFRQNTAGFVHDLPKTNLSNVAGDSTYVRVQVLTNAGALDREAARRRRPAHRDRRGGSGRSLARRAHMGAPDGSTRRAGGVWPGTPTRMPSSWTLLALRWPRSEPKHRTIPERDTSPA
jgi:hypothetical protein